MMKGTAKYIYWYFRLDCIQNFLKLCDLNKNLGVTIITATHDYKMLGVSDRIAWFSDGSLDKIQTKDHFKVLKGSIN